MGKDKETKEEVQEERYKDVEPRKVLKEIDKDAYIQKRIDDAVKRMIEEEYGMDAPSWSNEDGGFKNCIGTSTQCFGDKSIEIKNHKFVKNHKEKGFRMLDDNEEPMAGDIYQYSDNDKSGTWHSIMLVGFDENGDKMFRYGTGGDYDNEGNYTSTKRSYTAMNGYNTFDHEHPTRRIYRFVGTPEELADIDKQNEEIRKNNELLTYKPETQVKGLEVKEAPYSLRGELSSIEPFLDSIISKHEKK